MLCVPGIHYPTLHHTIALNYNREMVDGLIITATAKNGIINNYIYFMKSESINIHCRLAHARIQFDLILLSVKN